MKSPFRHRPGTNPVALNFFADTTAARRTENNLFTTSVPTLMK